MAFLNNPEFLKVRQLQVEITLNSGVFNEDFQNTKIINHLTVDAVVQKTLNNNFTCNANITIFGMSNTDIAILTTTGYQPLIYEANKIKLYAQYEGEAKALCFSGFIVKSYADYNNPSRPMYFNCQASYQDAIKFVANINTTGTQNIADIFSNIANNLGYGFTNNGVNGSINNCILFGSYVDQLKQLAKKTQTNCIIDLDNIKIAPQGQSLNNLILNINNESGLLGYPVPNNFGVQFKIRYTPQLQIGQYVQLQTVVYIPKSTGQWFVYDIESNLNNNHENWFMDVKASYNNLIGGVNGST